MFSGLEDYIKFDNSIDKILDVDYIKQLAIDFKNVSINPNDDNSIKNMLDMMSNAHSKQFNYIN